MLKGHLATMKTAIGQATLSARVRHMLGVEEDPNVKVGINGFGKLGRLLACAIREIDGIDLVAINDPYLEADYMAYMLQHDSAPGGYLGTAEAVEDELMLDGRPCCLFAERESSKIPWHSSGATFVVEASGRCSSVVAAQAHLKGGAQHVVVAAPCDDCPQLVVGINETTYSGQSVVSGASAAAHCLALLLKVVNDAFGVEQASASVLQACSKQQLEEVVAGPSGKGHADWRSGRGEGLDIIPTQAEPIAAVRAILPSLARRIGGAGFRLPAEGSASVVDLTVELRKQASMETIRGAFAAAAFSMPLRGRLGHRDDEVDGGDVCVDGRAAIFDGRASMALSPTFVKLIGWFPNEWGYCRRLIELILHMHLHDLGVADQINEAPPTSEASLQGNFGGSETCSQAAASSEQASIAGEFGMA